MTHTFKGPKYIVRFDDICPTMNWDVWKEIEDILIEARVMPILAVVPDNQDPELQVAPPAADFWSRVRAWQARGWSIALHGYQHAYVTRDSGLIGQNDYSEFAGLSKAVQSEKIRKGLSIFEREGVRADVWIAPAHSFDRVTLQVLAQYGPRLISDGYTRWPFVDQFGLNWVPQQLCWFKPCHTGVWTVCSHCNPWTGARIDKFRRDLLAYRSDITSLVDVMKLFQGRQRSLGDTLHSLVFGGTLTSRHKIMRRLGYRILNFCGGSRQ
jgi:hypothetical protein